MTKNVISIRRISLILTALLTLLNFGCASVEQLYYSVPGMLPGTTGNMKTSGYWIDRHSFPDRLIMNADDIERLNSRIIEEMEINRDILKLPVPCPASMVLEKTDKIGEWFRSRSLFHEDGSPVVSKFFDAMERKMGLYGIPENIVVRFGIVTNYTDQRVFPARSKLYSKRGDIDFDELQNSALDIGTPVAIMHESTDGKWFYVFDELNAGWIEKTSIALTSREELRRFIGAKDFVVVTAPRASIYTNSAMTDYHAFARTGTRMPLTAVHEGDTAEVVLPFRNDDGSCVFERGFLTAGTVHEGYLPYTPRSILETSFGLLNAPYGWGGMYGERDCSRFIQSIFATVGIRLPRNSSKQAQVGNIVAEFDETVSSMDKEKRLISDCVGGITVLYMRGHIMIYLGYVGDKAYAIHDTWGYRKSTWHGDIVRVIARVAVTDLHLGRGSKRGDYLKRIVSARNIL